MKSKLFFTLSSIIIAAGIIGAFFCPYSAIVILPGLIFPISYMIKKIKNYKNLKKLFNN